MEGNGEYISKILNKISVVENIRPTGAVHIGAHWGQERDLYKQLGLTPVIWIEGDPVVFEKLQSNIEGYTGQFAHLALLSDSNLNSVNFNITSNYGGSSSILELDDEIFKTHYPGLMKNEEKKLQSYRFDTWIDKNNISLNNVNFLNIDVQGSEYNVFLGMGKYLDNIELIMTEINLTQLYKKSRLLNDLDKLLNSKGFYRFITMYGFPQGEAFYVRKKNFSLLNKLSNRITSTLLVRLNNLSRQKFYRKYMSKILVFFNRYLNKYN